jgi:tRNA U54 and U55 pseudouridine synthase Pus10
VKIPKQVTIGKTKIKIDQPVSLRVQGIPCNGCFDRSDNSIDVAKKDVQGYKFSNAERSETFWHEITHAILHDMKNKLSYDEKLVTAFSQRLDQAIRTARF